MYFQRVFAMVDADRIVQNRAVFDDYETANQITRAVYGEQAMAVECTQWRISNGYTCQGSSFYDPDGNLAERVPDFEEQADILREQAETAIEDNVELDYRLSIMELGL